MGFGVVTGQGPAAAPAARGLAGRAALVTGASRGLGLVVAKRFAAAGADLVVCARDGGRLGAAILEIEAARLRADQRVLGQAADVAKSGDVAKLTAAALAEFPDLSVLVSNAGVHGPIGRLEAIDAEGFRSAMETNLMGPVLLAQALVPHFRRRGGGKIIQISGGGATGPMPRFPAYAASKAAVVRLMESLALDLAGDRIDVNSVAPGMMDTRLLDEVVGAGPEAVGRDYYDRVRGSRERGACADPTLAAELCLFLASGASDGLTGKLISAVWDDWGNWMGHLPELLEGDLFTLRRITGRDRGTGWGDK
jgi:NAD(P)-dependent dehydrogenase (short-subunit alcohol dehydrogenase family)